MTNKRRLALTLLALMGMGVLSGCSGNRVLDTSANQLDRTEESVEVFYWPLTHMPAPDGTVIGRRPIAMKIDNFGDARPQTGLIDADIVYEVVVEGDMTRFHTIFHSTLPETAGPMRSARLSDAWIVPQWGTYLFYSGSTEEVRYALESAGLDLLVEGTDPRIWERIDSRIAPHNLYVHVADVPAIIGEFGIDVNHWTPRTLAFVETDNVDLSDTVDAQEMAPDALASDDVGAAAVTQETSRGPSEAREITIPFGGVVATWKWDVASQTYLRWQDGEPHVDEKSGRQIYATNVVVLWTDYSLFEHGLASMFQKGMRSDGNWTAQTAQPPLVSTVSGAPITYQVGNTWFELVTDGTQIVVE